MSDFFRFAQLSIVLRSKKHAYRLQFIFMISSSIYFIGSGSRGVHI